MMNKMIAVMLRFFHAIFWLLLFAGVLISKSIRVSTICTVVILLGIMLWDILGYCFVSILENQFDPLREKDGSQAPPDASFIYEYSFINPEMLGKAFNYFIYLVLFIGLYRIYRFMNPVIKLSRNDS